MASDSYSLFLLSFLKAFTMMMDENTTGVRLWMGRESLLSVYPLGSFNTNTYKQIIRLIKTSEGGVVTDLHAFVKAKYDY